MKTLKNPLLEKENFLLLQRRNGRVVDCGGLENRCPPQAGRGFESLFLRQMHKAGRFGAAFFMCIQPPKVNRHG